MSSIQEKAKKVKAVILDGDGVFFTGRVLIHPKDGEFLKERSHIDGQGISLCRAAGILFALVSGETSGFLEVVGEKLNNLPSVREGKWKPILVVCGPQQGGKAEAVNKWISDNGISWDECAVMGDDLSDIQLLERAGFKTAPAQAEDAIKNMADWSSPRRGGDGAIRDLCDLILKSKGIDPRSLSLR